MAGSVVTRERGETYIENLLKYFLYLFCIREIICLYNI